METALELVVLAAVVVGVEILVRRTGGSTPLVLVVVGVVGSYLPFVPTVVLDPELVLVGLLPPLLYAAAQGTSLLDVRHHLKAISLLSVGLVLVTAVVVGVVVHLLLPVPLAVGLALGAVVAPPDAVAATAVARRVGLPRAVVTVLEGESLVNDATALVLLRTALAAAALATAGGTAAAEGLDAVGVGADLLLAAGGGVAVGVVVASVAGRVRRRLDDAVLDTTLSFTAPFVAYLPAEELGASGVLAVVVTGLLLAHRAPRQQGARARIAERLTWRTVRFLLEGGVFVLIGLQASDVVGGAFGTAGGVGPARALGVAGAVLGVVVVVRLVYVAVVLPLAGLHAGRSTRGSGDRVSRRGLVVVGWAGMRGVVTLAAAASLPEGTPEREVLVLTALVVVAGTLVLQGLTLPPLVRRLGLGAPDPAHDALLTATVLERLRYAAEERLDGARRAGDGDDVVEELRRRVVGRSERAWERLGRGPDGAGGSVGPGERERTWVRLRRQMLQAEREELLRVRDEGLAPDEVLRRVLGQLDVEESLLVAGDEEADPPDEDAADDVERGLAGAPRPSGGEPPPTAVAATGRAALLRAGPAGDDGAPCDHLRAAPAARGEVLADGCDGCLPLGEHGWVALRRCLTCGFTGCCDSSPHRHARAHAGQERHPVARSAEPGEAWRWCYPDELLG